MSLNNRKQERDFTAEVKALEPEAEQLTKDGKLQEAIDKITLLEKQTRNAADMSSTSTLLVLLARLCWSTQDLDTLNAQLTIMAKKHGQIKEAVVRMVDEAIKWLPELRERRDKGDYNGKDKVDRWLELVKTLRDITEGKIFLELPRARLTGMLAAHHEALAETAPKDAQPLTAKEHLDTAADLMSDIQVETYSSMDKREKTEFILEQMRLESQRGNWVRVRVGSRKINRVYLKDKEVQDIKLRFYDLIVQLALQDDEYLEACQAYQEVWDTEEVKADAAKELSAIENIIIYVVLASYNNEQSDMIHKLYANAALQKAPLHFDLLKCFVTKELMRWKGIEDIYGTTLRQSPIFASGSTLGKKIDKRWEELHKRVVEHNIRVVATYYSRITLPRLSALLDLPPLTTERTLCQLVTSKTVYARIDRPAGIVDFRKKQNVNGTLNGWSGDLGKMLDLVEKASHLVSKEYAMHEAVKGKKVAA
ncbi:26S proteasome regulatory subunit N5 [Cryptococcus wingfieldii CBS 7118]|uniref:26S proteasome regulatory subunit N5 n=1 Tax=Cryptococcus wingfieldii CBS 7118 TaxID=1295528 RepID=A0A1E3J346_9TREE|nr:26S proteasome regulatory subunit N5 [Cryptococcus wingfieldii CBS 7118]ODN95273.1 26S proteasome regulatory subunit N5 [Cryptococcus wingfieldii CBS 7118]